MVNLFRSKEAQDIETVTARLDAARAELDRAETQLRERSLAAALSADPHAAEPDLDAVRRGRERVELLEAALAAAEAAERTRLAAARSDAEKSRLRAMRQHIALATKAAREFEAAAANMASAWGRITDAIGASNALRKLGEEATKTSTVRLLALRQLAKADHSAGGRHAPGVPDKGAFGNVVTLNRHFSEMPDLSAELETRLLASWRAIGGDQ